jgi:hypothetical protein
MIDWDALKEKEVIYVKNMRTAEQLVNIFGFSTLVGVRDDKYRQGKKIYMLKNNPSLLDLFKTMVTGGSEVSEATEIKEV